MVAEPVIETTLEIPVEEAAVAVPESPPESTPAPENPEVETSFGDAFLESIDNASKEDAGKDGQNAASDAVVPPAQPQPSAEQIRQDERNRVAAENRINGLKWVVADDAPAQLAKLRSELSEEGWEILTTQINRMKGAFQPLLDRAVDVDTTLAPQIKSAALKEAEDFTFNQFAEAAKEELGIDLAESRANFRSWGDVGKYIVKEARKDMVSKADYVSRAKVKEDTDKLEQALKERGNANPPIVTRSLKELMGSTGPDTPAATGGAGGRLTKARFEAMSIEDQMKVSSEDMARIYGAIR